MMNTNSFPQVDVCVVAYNQAPLIESSIQSILDQDYPNFRIIVSDDDSQDETPAVLKRLAELHPDKIKLNFNPKNLGITGNSSYVLSLATANYVALLAGDDLMRKDRLSKQVHRLQQHPQAAGCMSSVLVEDVTTQESHVGHFPDFASEDFLKILTTYNQVPSSTLMLNRTQCGDIHYDPRTPIVSDWLFVNEIAFKGMVYVDEPLTIYRRHASNTTLHGADKTYLDDRLIAVDILFSKLQRHYWKFRYARSNVYLGVANRYWLTGKKRQGLWFIVYALLEYPCNKNVYESFLKVIQKRFRG
ncbi:MAG: glycosyltransferase [Candidatus Margulisiibacteriota bacterium]